MDYEGAGGKTPVGDWFKGLPHGARAKVETLMDTMARLPQSDWVFSWSKSYKGAPGIFELRTQFQNIQYRPLFIFGPLKQQITILVGAIEQGGVLIPRGAAKKAMRLKAEIEKNPNQAKTHEFPEDELF